MDTNKYTASILLPYDDTRTVSDYEYESKEDAEWHMRMRYRQYFENEESFKRAINIEPVAPFSRGWFTRSLTPWCACFVDGKLQEFSNTYWEGMETRYLWIDPKEYKMQFGVKEVQYWVYFWASPDEENARVIAEGYLAGYLLGKTKNS